jgi:hypothetical protein
MDNHKTKWMGSTLKLLTCYAQEADDFLDSIVSGNETWVFHRTTESKQWSLQVMTWFKGQVADFYDSGDTEAGSKTVRGTMLKNKVT